MSESAIHADDLQEVVVILDASLRVAFWSRAGMDVTGLGRETVMGADVHALFDDESRADVDGLLTIVRSGGTVPGVELRGRDLVDMVHPDDRERARWPIHERRTGERATHGFRVRFVKKQGDAATVDLQSVVTSLNSVGLYFSTARSGEGIRFAGTEGIAMDVTEVEGLRTLSDGIGRLLPICSTCRKIRTAGPDGDVWEHLEDYVRVHANAALSHTYCPDCLRKLHLDTGDPA